ncbi:uncharacterized protein LOC144179920 [Haemaphysalis longicornis]
MDSISAMVLFSLSLNGRAFVEVAEYRLVLQATFELVECCGLVLAQHQLLSDTALVKGVSAVEETFGQLHLNTHYVLSVNGFLNALQVLAGMGNFFTYMIFGVGSKSQHFLYACCFGYSLNGIHFLVTGLASQHVAEVLPITIYYKVFQASGMSMYFLGSVAVLTYDLPTMPDCFCGMATGMFTGLLHLVHLVYILLYVPSP